jgi:tetratricopeptide (TPR) repeat protein
LSKRGACLLFVGLAFAVYANSLGGEFLFDDLSTFRRAGFADDSLLDAAQRYRPVRYVSLHIDRVLYGNRAWGYHVTNTLLHGITSFVVFVLLRRLAGPVAALAGALLFVTHPVHTESVAYISGRRDILTTLFFLLGFLCWVEFHRSARRRWIAAAAGLYALALGAKEMAVTLPLICVLHDLLLDPARARRQIPLHAVAGLAAAAVAVYVAFFSDATHQFEWHGGSMAANFATSVRIAAHYALLVVFPLRLLGDYSFDAFPLSRSFLEARVLLALFGIAAALAVAVRLRRRAPLVSFGLAWFLVTLLPVLHIKPFHELAAEHYLYLPSVGACLLLGLGFERLRATAGVRPAWIALGLVLAAFSVRTVARNRDWRDGETFWNSVVATAPRSARGLFNVGMIHAGRSGTLRSATERRAALERAAASVERAIAIRPDYAKAHYQLGRIYERLGRPEEARARWDEALRLGKQMRLPSVDLGELCVRLGRYDEAIRIYENDLAAGFRTQLALRGLIRVHTQLASAAATAGRDREREIATRKAFAAAEALLRLTPEDAALLRETIRLARAAGEPDRAEQLRKRIREREAPGS